MGYDLHITRARDWTDSEAMPVTEAEWRRLVAADPSLELTGAAEAAALWRGHPSGQSAWLDLRDGRVVAKNPDEPTIAKMIAIAGELGARVVGDDGETYESPGLPPRPPRQSWSARIASLLQRLRPTPAPVIEAPPFGVGDRVRDTWGNEATVLAVDTRAMHGLGSITVRFDDGRELTYAMCAHGLKLVAPTG